MSQDNSDYSHSDDSFDEDGVLHDTRGRSKRKTQRKRFKSRWQDHVSKTLVPGIPPFIPFILCKEELDALLLRMRIDEICYNIDHNQIDTEFFSYRSKSPVYVYNNQGKRVNTKEQRAKNRLENERSVLVEAASKINPMFKPPITGKQGYRKSRKVYIPVDKFPEYNFVGLILGPRGETQKKLEAESGAKILIRGRGSSQGSKNKYPDSDDDPHVLIRADSDATIKKAARIVKKLLIPVEEGKNDLKRIQLRTLAEKNGTLRESTWQPSTRTWKSAEVFCKHCGEISHVTSDCPLKDQPVDQDLMDEELASFLEEIGESDGTEFKKSSTSSNANEVLDQFMEELDATMSVNTSDKNREDGEEEESNNQNNVQQPSYYTQQQFEDYYKQQGMIPPMTYEEYVAQAWSQYNMYYPNQQYYQG